MEHFNKLLLFINLFASVLAADKSGYSEYGNPFKKNESVIQHFQKLRLNNDPQGTTSEYVNRQNRSKGVQPQHCHRKDGRWCWQKNTI